MVKKKGNSGKREVVYIDVDDIGEPITNRKITYVNLSDDESEKKKKKKKKSKPKPNPLYGRMPDNLWEEWQQRRLEEHLSKAKKVHFVISKVKLYFN